MMANKVEEELTDEQALIRAQEALESGPLAQMGIHIETPDEMRLRMLNNLVNAQSVDDILSEGGTSGWGDHENRSVVIRRVSYAPSTKKGGLGFYVVVNAIDVDTLEPLVLTSGSENVVLQVAKLAQVGKLDVPVKLVSNTTGDGNTVHRLVKGDAGESAPY